MNWVIRYYVMSSIDRRLQHKDFTTEAAALAEWDRMGNQPHIARHSLVKEEVLRTGRIL
jgi:hypothetical protein